MQMYLVYEIPNIIKRRKHEKNPFTLSLSLVFAPR